jgi:hypothetical protein
LLSLLIKDNTFRETKSKAVSLLHIQKNKRK